MGGDYGDKVHGEVDASVTNWPEGVSPRQYFAGVALHALMSSHARGLVNWFDGLKGDERPDDYVCRIAVDMADRLIVALEKGQ